MASHVIGLVDGLPPGRFAVDVACPRGSQTWARLQGRDGVELHAIRPHRGPAPGDTRSWLTLLRLAGRADVVHVHSAKAGFLGRLAAATRGKRGACVFTPHGWSFWAAEGAESRLYVRLERLAAHWCRTIVALSGAERDAGLEEGVGRSEQYRVIPNGVSLERFSLPRAVVRGRILMVGRLAPPKRPDLALRALATVRTRIPEAELLVVGDGLLRPDAERLASDLGLGGAVRFLGHRDDVATDAGGIRELVQDGHTGAVAPPEADALAAALEGVLADPARAAEQGAEGRREAASRLSLETMVGSLVALYDEMARTRE
ncbi:MAG: hypothetical protein AUI15_38130 [Actinobacteria bacterium 13_2_20CM_2_66_6]|nr:MAG: hypothetical protein AUI15_38130 [Actinobacteria bacterium 13_2_20CM_2_66_6]